MFGCKIIQVNGEEFQGNQQTASMFKTAYRNKCQERLAKIGKEGSITDMEWRYRRRNFK